MNREFDLQQDLKCEGCGGIPGEKFEGCAHCLSFLTAFQTSPDKAPNNPVAVGGGKAPDVEPLQGFLKEKLCEECTKPVGSNPACDLCATLKKTQEEAPPFTKEQVKQRHANMRSEFIPPPTGRIFDLVVPLSSPTIGSIDWTMHNCANSTLVLMLSSSNAGMNSINQQKFAGYILAVIINRLQESGKCDPILLEVFRLELSIISGNSSWSNWSELIEFQDLYKVCVDHQIILDNEVEFVLPNDNGLYNVGQTLTEKHGSTLIGAFKWNPSGNVLANGIFSSDFASRFRISAVILHCNDHFSIILISQGIWLIDGKGNRTGEFRAESSIQELTIEEFQKLCSLYGSFYFFEEIPFAYEMIHLFGRQDLPPRRVYYPVKWHFLYDDGTMICETTGTRVKLSRTVFMTDDRGNHFRVFPALPSPQASCVSGPWVPPPPPPPPVPCAQSYWVPPTPPPQQVPCANVAQALPPPPPPHSPINTGITKNNMSYFIEQCSGMSKWSVSIVDPKDPKKIIFHETGVYLESTNQRGVILYTFDSDTSEPKKLYKEDHEVNNFIKELNKRFNERSK